ncbi:AbrB/MazE/SpoVT family DNA-binding domain-containing protein [Pontibacillus salicampi]|uniref:AbrB/MazE/SpoVT family DNA-binding domain-containing protein n=1 Tax=Pontibacillus salicampi TaxID=1449801 RepID=A0ABV6LTR7_9BACI
MKTTGIVRKMDELGRIVIPAELRRMQSWGERQPVEIFVEGNNIILRKHNGNSNQAELIEQLEALHATANTKQAPIIQKAIKLY